MGVWGCVCIPINQASCLLYWLDPLTLAVAGASWSPAFLQQTKDSASCSTRSITASPTPAAKAEGERRTQKLPSSSQMQLSKLPLRSPPFFWGGVFFKMSMHRTIPPQPHRLPRKAERRVVKNGLNEGVPFEKLIISCLVGFLV